MTTLKWKEHDEVRWNSVIDIFFYNNTKANRFMRFVTRGKGVYPLKRSYTSDADYADGQPLFSDLILVVHGESNILKSSQKDDRRLQASDKKATKI